jgi:hypothetical protein
MAKKRFNKKDDIMEPVINCDRSIEVAANCDQLVEVDANCDHPDNGDIILSQYDIERLILAIRGKQVLIDRDLGNIYGVETKRLNEQVRRNIARFPDRYRFQLTKDEMKELVANCDRFNMLKHSTSAPYAFTVFGVSMLPSVLNSQKAIDTSIRIIDAFVAMRSFRTRNRRKRCLEEKSSRLLLLLPTTAPPTTTSTCSVAIRSSCCRSSRSGST